MKCDSCLNTGDLSCCIEAKVVTGSSGAVFSNGLAVTENHLLKEKRDEER